MDSGAKESVNNRGGCVMDRGTKGSVNNGGLYDGLGC